MPEISNDKSQSVSTGKKSLISLNLKRLEIAFSRFTDYFAATIIH